MTILMMHIEGEEDENIASGGAYFAAADLDCNGTVDDLDLEILMGGSINQVNPAA